MYLFKKNNIPKILTLILFLFITTISVALFITFKQNGSFLSKKSINDKSNDLCTVSNDSWAENTLKQMTLEEKIAQLMMIRVYSNKNNAYNNELVNEITKYQPGGVCFFQGSPVKQIELTNRLQSVSKIPLLVSIDGEWGVAMRLDSSLTFPYQMTLGALDAQNDELIYKMGAEVAKQCNTLGIHINFAPCVDINSNSLNPVINFRSFGENRERVAQKSMLYMQGMQSEGIITCAKHFPGHGDTKTDSHHDLPVIDKSYKELDSLEFFPFKEMINKGVDMVMISHLNVPALDPAPNSIASLSKKSITDVLIDQMGFKGIVITDAMDMKGLRNSYPEGGEAEITALLAGVDILLLPNALKEVIPAIKKAVENGTISEELIDKKCLKILKMKQEKELTQHTTIKTQNISEKLNDKKSENIIKEIEEKALTLLSNYHAILPLTNKENDKTALLFTGNLVDSTFYKNLAKEKQLAYYALSSTATKNEESLLINQLKKYDKVILFVISKNQQSTKKYGIAENTITFIEQLSKQKKIILGLYSNPYLLNYFKNVSSYAAIFVGYKATYHAVRSGLEALYGEIPFVGKLPVSTTHFPVKFGINTKEKDKNLSFNETSHSFFLSKNNGKIDSLVANALEERIFPGCQILAIYDGEILYHKNFGKISYSPDAHKVDNYTLYDVASITKPLATTLAIMKLYEEGKIKLKDKLGDFLSYVRESNKADLTIEELLTHTSGLPAYIPFYKNISNGGNWDSLYLSNTPIDNYHVIVASNVFLHTSYIDTIHNQLVNCKLGKKKYIYSDLGYLFLKEVVETLTAIPLDKYVIREFYQPLGLNRTLFNPLSKIAINEIAPTENDTSFRKQMVHGYVHDQSAALFGGVQGNAGLFSTASELAIILQMLMNGGSYNGKTFFSPQTVKFFTTTRKINGCERRSLGFDTPNFKGPSPYLPEQADNNSYGHFGFTGTAFWCSPKDKLIYIFLSNRVHPNVEPNLLSKSRLRVHFHEMIYEKIEK